MAADTDTTSADDLAADFEAIYRANVERIYRYCFARVRDHAGAEDATSETFLRALTSIERFKGGNVTAWLFVIARNVTTDRLRAGYRTALETEGAVAAATDGGPEQAALDAEEEERLRGALAVLGGDQRAAIELQLAGWSLSESGAAMGKSTAAIKMLRARGVARLRVLLDSPDEGDKRNEG